MENSFETLWRLLARVERSLSVLKMLTRGRAEVRGSVMVELDAEDETEEMTIDMLCSCLAGRRRWKCVGAREEVELAQRE
jgi:hypothetical protein